MNASELVEAYDKLIARASNVAGCYVCEAHMARISFEGETAIISWPEAESGYYNSCSIETQTAKFPAYLLDASESEVEYYKGEQKRLAEEANRRWYAERARQQEENERRVLSELQRKYGQQ